MSRNTAVRTVAELQQLENAAWASPSRRALYATRHVPGFPWHTVEETISSSEGEFAASNASDTAPHGGPRPPSLSSTVFSSTVRRHVIPYDFPFAVFVKGRWVGRRLLDVYAEELPHHTPAYYEACLRNGRLYCAPRATLGNHNTQRRRLKRAAAAPSAPPTAATAETPVYRVPHDVIETTQTNGEEIAAPRAVSPSSRTLDELNVTLQHGDVVHHTVHRHEIPLTVGSSGVDPVFLIAVCIRPYGLICVNKPTGLPTHATGRYFYNSLTALLEYVLAPKRLRAWLVDDDPLLQSLVSTTCLSEQEKTELYEYYVDAASTSAARKQNGTGLNVPEGNTHADGDAVDADKAPRPCHRLDKVTSGVLLLAVHQEAAKRIGTVLMQKAQEVDAAVSSELANVSSDGPRPLANASDGQRANAAAPASTAEAPSAATPLYRILRQTFDLQKYYLARVAGTLSSPAYKSTAVDSLHGSGSEPPSADGTLSPSFVWHVSGSEACLQPHNARVQSLLSSAPQVCPCRSEAPFSPRESRAPAPRNDASFPSGVLVTLPIQPPSAANRSVDGRRETSFTATLAASAATLCQTLSVMASRAGSSPERAATPPDTGGHARHMGSPAKQSHVESVVLCTPYTGRLHQLRCHLSALGCPIVGDAVYTPSAHAAAVDVEAVDDDATEETARDSTTAAAPTHRKNTAWVRNERDYVYFDATQLPKAYRACMDETRAQGTRAGTASTSGTKRPRGDTSSCDAAEGIEQGEATQRCLSEPPSRHASDPAAPSTCAVSSSSWQAEPLCYECAGLLPIVAAKECATGISAVCLHAWAYEVRASLLRTGKAAEEDVADRQGLERERVNEADGEPSDVSRAVGEARWVVGDFVHFEAAPPRWAIPANVDHPI